MNEREFVILALRVLRAQIAVKRLVVLVEVKHRARGILGIARVLAVYVTVEIECVLVSLEDIVEKLTAPSVHRLAELSVKEIVCRRKMSYEEYVLVALWVDLVELILYPYQRFVGISALVGVICGIGIYIDTDEINALDGIVKSTPIKLVRLFL